MAGFLLERVRKMVERGVEEIKAKEAVLDNSQESGHKIRKFF